MATAGRWASVSVAFGWVHRAAHILGQDGATGAAVRRQLGVLLGAMTWHRAGFATHADPCGSKILVLVVDNAGWHRAHELVVPPDVRLHFLPPCTQELQPAEPFWVLVREAVANEAFARLADLRQRILRRCRRLAGDRATVRGAIGFRWAVSLET